MSNRNNRPKRNSKLKHQINNDKYLYNSPGKLLLSANFSSAMCPKQPPNVSNHYLHAQKKRHQIKGQYYITGKQNKGRIMNNQLYQKQKFSYVQTTDRLKQKRYTHHVINPANDMDFYQSTSKVYQAKKTNQNQNLKTVYKSKLNVKQPIAFANIKSQKIKLIKHSQKQNKVQRHFKRDKQKQIYIPQDKMCSLRCLENLSSNSIAQSKVSSIYYPDMGTLDQSYIPIDKQKSIQIKKGVFHRSPKIMSPTAIKIIQNTPQQQIVQFEAKINEINTNFQHDSLNYMQSKDFEFVQSKNLNCYLGNQMHLDWKKRSIVVNWMIEFVEEAQGTRQASANGVNIFDRYLSATKNIPLDHMQCIAAACLLISLKLQGIFLGASYLQQSMQFKYSKQQIMQEQMKIFDRLDFKVNTPTLYGWANRLAVQWDVYLDNVDLSQFDIIMINKNNLKFKNSDQTSYYNFRWLCQYIDFSMLDIYTLRYQPRMLSLAFIYLILVLILKLNTKQHVISTFPYSSQFLLEKSTFHQFFSKFLRDSFNQDFFDLLPMIQYCSTFVILPLTFELPRAASTDGQNQQQSINYEKFCSYQTKNENMFTSFFKRNRNIF